MQNVVSVNATLLLPCRLISSLDIFLKLANELAMESFLEADDTKITVKESSSPLKSAGFYLVCQIFHKLRKWIVAFILFKKECHYFFFQQNHESPRKNNGRWISFNGCFALNEFKNGLFLDTLIDAKIGPLVIPKHMNQTIERSNNPSHTIKFFLTLCFKDLDDPTKNFLRGFAFLFVWMLQQLISMVVHKNSGTKIPLKP